MSLTTLTTTFQEQDLPLWGDLAGKDEAMATVLYDASIMLGVLHRGTAKGYPSVIIRIDTPDGHVFLTHTTARLLVTAAKLIEARYPGLMTDD